ncbi:hypothetical protein ABVT39_020440 [Epinephelus coioides]
MNHLRGEEAANDMLKQFGFIKAEIRNQNLEDSNSDEHEATLILTAGTNWSNESKNYWPVVTQLHNRFQFPSPACLVAPRPPLLSAACLPDCLAAGRTGADPSRPVPCSLLTQYAEKTEREDLAVSWWTFLPSRGIHNSGGRGESVHGGEECVIISYYFCADGEFISRRRSRYVSAKL